VTRVGVTGHRELAEPERWTWVRREVDTALAALDGPLVVVSSLAGGADQVVADVVLDRGGSLHAVVAFADFRETLPTGGVREGFDALLARATDVEVIEPCATHELAYLAAGKRVVDLADVMIAVWDGEPARGTGGTAEIVDYAQETGTALLHVDPVELTVHWR
jgi:hypothetical protein